MMPPCAGARSDARAAISFVVALVCGFAVMMPAPAPAQPYGLAPLAGPQTVAGGGTPTMIGGPYTIAGTAGQSDAGGSAIAGPAIGGPYTIAGGFWQASLPDSAGSPTADLSITIEDANDPVQDLQSIVYQIDATNAGPDTAHAVSVVVTLATGLTFESALAPGWTCDPTAGIVTCTRAELMPSSTLSITLIARAPAGPATMQTNATINCLATDPAIANNSSTATTTVISAPAGAPTIVITTPTTMASARATGRCQPIAGTASAAAGEIARVTWTSDRGGSGDATGTTSWTLPGLVLQPGVNVVTVTATDTNGLTATDVIALIAHGVLPRRGIDRRLLRHRHRDRQSRTPQSSTARSRSSRPRAERSSTTFRAPPRSRQTIAVDTIPGVEATACLDRRHLEHGRAARGRTHDALERVRLRRPWRGSDRSLHRSGISPKARRASSRRFCCCSTRTSRSNRATVRYLREDAPPLERTYEVGADGAAHD